MLVVVLYMFNKTIHRDLVAYSQGIPQEFPGNGEVLAIWPGTPSPNRSRDSNIRLGNILIPPNCSRNFLHDSNLNILLLTFWWLKWTGSLRRIQRIFIFLILSTESIQRMNLKNFQGKNGRRGNELKGIPRELLRMVSSRAFRKRTSTVPGEWKRGIFGEFPGFWKIGELPGQIGEPCSRGICN